MADFLRAYCTTLGFYGWSHASGAKWTKALCAALDAHAETAHLSDIMTEVNNKLPEMLEGVRTRDGSVCRAASDFDSHLRKQLWFARGDRVVKPVERKPRARRVVGLRDSAIDTSPGVCKCACEGWPASRMRCAEHEGWLMNRVREEVPDMSACTLLYRCVCVCVCV